mgnify:CR=1 FL=1
MVKYGFLFPVVDISADNIIFFQFVINLVDLINNYIDKEDYVSAYELFLKNKDFHK